MKKQYTFSLRGESGKSYSVVAEERPEAIVIYGENYIKITHIGRENGDITECPDELEAYIKCSEIQKILIDTNPE